MNIPQDTVIAVTDGEKLDLYRNTATGQDIKLEAMADVSVNDEIKSSGGRHASSSANPDHGQGAEDGFSAGVAQYLNKQALEGGFANLVVISAPRSLGELRKHYHKVLSAMLLLEIPKDLTGHSVADIEKAVMAG